MILAKDLKHEYLSWYNNNLEFESLNENLIRINSPFKDQSSDDVVIYVVNNPNDSTVTLTDDGFTIYQLELSGVDIQRSKNRRFVFEKNLETYGVSYNQTTDELYIKAPIEKFSESKHRLLQCLLFVNDMYMLSKPNIKNIFTEDVSEIFDKNDIIYTQDIIINGHSGMSHKFEFIIPSKKNSKEKFVKTVSTPNNPMNVKAFVTDVNQAKAVKRDKANAFYFILDDRKKSVNVEVNNLLIESDITPINFSDLQKNIDLIKN